MLRKIIWITIFLIFTSFQSPIFSDTGSTSLGSLTPEYIIALVAGIATGIGAPISLLQYFFGRKKQKMDSLMEIFEILNSDNHRIARAVTYKAFKAYENGNINAFNERDVEEKISMVRADMDQVGTLLHHDLIPKNIVLEAYWHTILMCWKVLEKNIKNERIQRQYPTYMNILKN